MIRHAMPRILFVFEGFPRQHYLCGEPYRSGGISDPVMWRNFLDYYPVDTDVKCADCDSVFRTHDTLDE